MLRKTIDVAWIKERANTLFAQKYPPSDKYSEEFRNGQRAGVAQLLTAILHETGNYKGFNYLDGSYEEETRVFYY